VSSLNLKLERKRERGSLYPLGERHYPLTHGKRSKKRRLITTREGKKYLREKKKISLLTLPKKKERGGAA